MGDSSSNSTMAMMIPYLHFTPGDPLIFEALHPSSKGALAGACIVLVLLAIIERYVAAMRSALEANWRRKALAVVAGRNNVVPLDSCSAKESTEGRSSEETREVGVEIEEVPYATSPSTEKALQSKAAARTRTIAPFIPLHDVSRGALYAIQALLGYALMLSVMTFQAAYMISIICGLGIGETMFGRVGAAAHRHA